MTPEKRGGPDAGDRKRIYLSLPANWTSMTDEERHRAALTMAEALQRRLGITDKSEQAGNGEPDLNR